MHRQHPQQLMTNLNSISSSLSSLDTVSRRTDTKTSAQNVEATMRRHSLASTSLLWPKSKQNRSPRNSLGSICFETRASLISALVVLLILTITRQVFDFLGQIWLQILVNFFTIISLIFALFGLHQRNQSYLGFYVTWSLLNSGWNGLVLCIYSKIYPVHLTEDFLSFNTGATSWWHSNGPGCLRYNISSMAQSTQLALIQPYAVTGCAVDYRLIESFQATAHALLSLLTSLLTCYVMSVISRRKDYLSTPSAGKLYHLNHLPSNPRNRIDSNPFPKSNTSKLSTSESLRSASKASVRSSQNSLSSARRRSVSLQETASARKNRSSSISSRRSRSKRGEPSCSSIYGTARGADNPYRRNRLSLSSSDYLPTYQPPHSSNANLLSTYGDASSIDSYTFGRGNASMLPSGSNHQQRKPMTPAGSTNPTYSDSRFSLYSRGSNATGTNNYDNLSHIYGNESRASIDGESIYNHGSTNQIRISTNGSQQQQKRTNVKNTYANNDSNNNINDFAYAKSTNHYGVHSATPHYSNQQNYCVMNGNGAANTTNDDTQSRNGAVSNKNFQNGKNRS